MALEDDDLFPSDFSELVDTTSEYLHPDCYLEMGYYQNEPVAVFLGQEPGLEVHILPQFAEEVFEESLRYGIGRLMETKTPVISFFPNNEGQFNAAKKIGFEVVEMKEEWFETAMLIENPNGEDPKVYYGEDEKQAI